MAWVKAIPCADVQNGPAVFKHPPKQVACSKWREIFMRWITGVRTKVTHAAAFPAASDAALAGRPSHIVILLLIHPECIKPDDIIDAEVILRSVALDITVPSVINPFPGNGKQGRILLHDGVGLSD